MKKIPLILFGAFTLSALSTAAERPNILFISVDDLRPELGCYGNTAIQSPNIDRLAESGIVFEEAYCQVPVCGATRASLMTGLYPTENRFVTYYSNPFEAAFDVLLLELELLQLLDLGARHRQLVLGHQRHELHQPHSARCARRRLQRSLDPSTICECTAVCAGC